MNKLPKLQKIRVLSQLIFTAILGNFAIYGIVRCPFAVPYVGCGNCPVIQCPGRKYYLSVWIGIFVSIFIFARAFCGWICPVGFFTEILSKLNPKKIKLPQRVSSVLGFGKYIVLIASLVTVIVYHNPRWAIPIRVGDYFNSIKLTFEHADQLWIVRTALILGFISLSMIINRFWCRFICPTGGIFEIFRKFGFLKIGRNDKCQSGCKACESNCSMDATQEKDNCISCAVCYDTCAKGAIEVKKKI